MSKNNIGIYVHIPFCKSKCYYCDFTSYANKEEYIDEYIKCLNKEIEYGAKFSRIVTTIYIGGGTPSYIDEKYIESILLTIYKNYKVVDNAEVTIEVNPGTCTLKKLCAYRKMGINRLSIGLQSSNDKLLKEIGRIHNYSEYVKTVEYAKKAGFKNISTDIIIGLPNQTIYDVEDTINKLIDLKIKHISVYSLIVEENTKMYSLINSKKLTLPDDEIERYMYWYAKRKLEDNGFIHYEISNFALPGYMSIHNIDCWSQKRYYGFGVAASSFIDNTRFTNTNCIQTYIKNIEGNKFLSNRKIDEKLNNEDLQKEYIMLGLRKVAGFNVYDFIKKYNVNPLKVYEKEFDKLFRANLIEIDYESLNVKLSKKGLDLANIVWEEFV